jgi:hypothetical protein
MHKLYEDVSTHYQNNKAGDYIIRIADSLYRLHWQAAGFDVTTLPKLDLASILTKMKTDFSVTKVDSALDPTGLYQQLLNCQNKNFSSLIIQAQKHTLSIHILDANGNLFTQPDVRLYQLTAINHYVNFLKTIQQQEIRCFEIEQTGYQQWKLSPIERPQPSENQGYLPVAVHMDSPKENALCTIQCGPQTFSGQANDVGLFEQIATFIISLRKNNQPYPLYINKISFSITANIKTADYLSQKQRLEKHLNRD